MQTEARCHFFFSFQINKDEESKYMILLRYNKIILFIRVHSLIQANVHD